MKSLLLTVAAGQRLLDLCHGDAELITIRGCSQACLLDVADVVACRGLAPHARIFAGAEFQVVYETVRVGGDLGSMRWETGVTTALSFRALHIPDRVAEGRARYDGIDIDIRRLRGGYDFERLFGGWGHEGDVALTMDVGQWPGLGERINALSHAFSDIVFHVADMSAFLAVVGAPAFLPPVPGVSLVLATPLDFDATPYPWLRGYVVESSITPGSGFSSAFAACPRGETLQ